MPKNRPGRMFYTTATKVVLHGKPAVEENMAGVAVKQKEPSITSGLAGRDSIAIAEDFALIVKGVVEVDEVAAAIPGSTVWINNTNNVLTLTDPGTGNGRQFGRVVEIEGERGIPTNRMAVDLDAKDSF